jgi:hypothetical protein
VLRREIRDGISITVRKVLGLSTFDASRRTSFN